jgi:hypothetical protein
MMMMMMLITIIKINTKSKLIEKILVHIEIYSESSRPRICVAKDLRLT